MTGSFTSIPPAGKMRWYVQRSGRLLLRYPLALTLVVVPLALVLGSLAGYGLGRVGSVPVSYQATRLQAVTADLAGIEGDYLLAAGDSHIERWPVRSLCGLPLVNAGFSGATAESYAAFLAELPLTRPPRAVIVTLGTNDANRKRFRDVREAEARFDGAFRPLLATFRRMADLVMVTGAPALDPGRAEGFSTDAAAAIGNAAASACRASPGCLVADPFPEGLESKDGVHFRDYRAAYRGIGQALCTALGRGAGLVASQAVRTSP